MLSQNEIIGAILSANSFVAGLFFRDQIENFKTSWEKVQFWSLLFVIFVTGFVVPIVYVIAVVTGWIYHKIFAKLHLGFIFKYIVFRRKLNYDYERGQEIHKIASRMNPKWYQIEKRIFVWIDKWVKNNYG